MMADGAGQSIPKQAGDWAGIVGAYRFLSNPDVEPGSIQGPHRERTRQACAGRGTVLCVSDITDLDHTTHPGTRGLGRLGDGAGRGLQQMSTLAVSPEGSTLGLVRQHWYLRPESPEGETRRQRQTRWCEADAWADAAREVGPAPGGCRFVHVCDRGGDNYTMIEACLAQNAGFLIRAMHDRRIQESEGARLWAHVLAQPVLTTMTVRVGAHRTGPKRDRRVGRDAVVSLRTARVTLTPPKSDPRHKDSKPREVTAVCVSEDEPPGGEGIDPVEWVLLTDEPAPTAEDARRLAAWYAHRWVIEEFHRVEKEGCRLEASQLDDAEDLKRLAAITGVIAVRLLRLRDLAEAAAPGSDDAATVPADNPAVLRALMPPVWIEVVARLSAVSPRGLTPAQFWRAIARQGGWIGRRGDGRPGWKVVWRGWHDVSLMVRGAELRPRRGP